MSERFKEPVLKTGDAQASVGSNPTLSATFLFVRQSVVRYLQKYPSGRRGSPAKGVGRETVARVQIPPSAPTRKPRTAMVPGFSFTFLSGNTLCFTLCRFRTALIEDSMRAELSRFIWSVTCPYRNCVVSKPLLPFREVFLFCLSHRDKLVYLRRSQGPLIPPKQYPLRTSPQGV